MMSPGFRPVKWDIQEATCGLQRYPWLSVGETNGRGVWESRAEQSDGDLKVSI